MKVAAAIAEILKLEGIDTICGYPVNGVLEAGAAAGIRPVIVRQERTGLHMADAMSRQSSGEKVGIFCMQYGPGTENAFGGVAQAYSEGVPLVVIPGGYPRGQANVRPSFSAVLNFQHVTKSVETLTSTEHLVPMMRRAFTQAKNGRPGPTMVEIPQDMWTEDVPEPLNYIPTRKIRTAPDPDDVRRAAEALVAAQRPVLYAGQGVHYSKAWAAFKELAELLEAPVTTSLEGKSAFPENHPLYLGAGGRAHPEPVHRFLVDADIICGIGASYGATSFGVQIPRGKTLIQNTIDPMDINKNHPTAFPLIGDARLTLEALVSEVGDRLGGKPRNRASEIAASIKSMRASWLEAWMPKLTDPSTPISPYRVLWDLLHTVDVANTVLTHDAGSPRDQISPFWESVTPNSYIGWGKSTQLGYGLGLAMGAKLANPDKLCMNFWGDAAIGFTGMDFETTVRERIPIMSVLSNNFSMAIELPVMPVSTEKYRATDISGNYAEFAKALGGYGERVTDPNEIVPAIKRGIAKTQEGTPVLLEFITQKETKTSVFTG
jgi:thiamine pyrophosphate-dependent acetolactate synthase large subunit-like protein